MLNLLWFLLPVAAAAGWFAARRSAQSRPDKFWNTSLSFHEGLNDLLSAPDALPDDLFNDLNDSGKDTAETHLALGNLYRRRGDVERAIRLHESVLDKKGVDDDVKATALLELAKDYDSAGLLDRSEQTLRRLIETKQRQSDAYLCLLQLHEKERDWSRAISVASELESIGGVSQSQVIGHYYCEMADTANASGYREEAVQLLDSALTTNPDCARAHMMLAQLALDDNKPEQALRHFSTLEKIRPDLMPDIIDDWFNALQQLGSKAKLQTFIEYIMQRKNAYSVIRTTRSVISDVHDASAADKFFKHQILQRPSLKGLRDWAHDQLAICKPDEKEKVQVICSMLDQVVEDKPSHRCSQCGFLGNMLHWRCPGCNNWDTVKPIIGVEGE